MPRPIWKGAISFGLVTIPVNLYSAVERSETLSFNLLHKKDNAPNPEQAVLLRGRRRGPVERSREGLRVRERSVRRRHG
jgi:DNA end-binding protein Ku